MVCADLEWWGGQRCSVKNRPWTPICKQYYPPPPKKIFSGFVIRTLLESPPTCPSQVNCMAVPTGNCLSRVSENWFRIFTLGVVIKVGLTEKK